MPPASRNTRRLESEGINSWNRCNSKRRASHAEQKKKHNKYKPVARVYKILGDDEGFFFVEFRTQARARASGPPEGPLFSEYLCIMHVKGAIPPHHPTLECPACERADVWPFLCISIFIFYFREWPSCGKLARAQLPLRAFYSLIQLSSIKRRRVGA